MESKLSKAMDLLMMNNGCVTTHEKEDVFTIESFSEIQTLYEHCIIKSKFSVQTTAFGGHGKYCYYLVPLKNRLSDLKSLIMSLKCNSNLPKVRGIPIFDQVLCVKGKNGLERVRVVSKGNEEGSIHVIYVDSGSHGVFPTSELFELPEELKTIAPLGYWVEIKTTRSYSLLSVDSAKFERWLKATTFCVGKVSESENGVLLSVQLYVPCARNCQRVTFESKLLDMEQWRYELMLSVGISSDVDIEVTDELFYHEDAVLKMKKMEEELYKYVGKKPDDPAETMQQVDKINALDSDRRILQQRMRKFFMSIEQSRIEDLNVKPDFYGVLDHDDGSVTEWHRCMRMGDKFLCFDHLEEWKADECGNFDKLTIRRLPMEFLRVPFLNILTGRGSAFCYLKREGLISS